MKFDVIVGNPPYNDSNNGNIPIYQNWVEMGEKIANYVALVIPSAMCISDERHGDEVRSIVGSRQTMKIRMLPRDTFEADVRTLYYVKDKTYNGKTTIISEDTEYKVDLYSEEYIFGDPMLKNILDKCGTKNSKKSWIKFNRMENSRNDGPVTKTVTCINPNGMTITDTTTRDNYLGNYRVVSSFFQDPDFRHYLLNVVDSDISVKDGYTVAVCSSQKEAENLISIMKSKLFLFIWKYTHTSRTLRTPQLKFIPKVDLSRAWTDQELYDHFGLTEEEIKYIEANVK